MKIKELTEVRLRGRVFKEEFLAVLLRREIFFAGCTHFTHFTRVTGEEFSVRVLMFGESSDAVELDEPLDGDGVAQALFDLASRGGARYPEEGYSAGQRQGWEVCSCRIGNSPAVIVRAVWV